MSSKSIRRIVSFTLLASLAACTSTGSGAQVGTAAANVPPITGAGEFSMQAGAATVLPDHSTLRYLRLVDDSRCAPDVQCVWAGDAEIEMQWTPMTGAPEAFRLHTGKPPREQMLGAYRVTLLSLERGSAPPARLRLDAEGGGQ
jgi:hypothetical protein